MIRFREHRGSLKDSMATVREFPTIADLAEYLRQRAVIKRYQDKPDERTGWERTYIVIGDDGVLGFTDRMQ